MSSPYDTRARAPAGQRLLSGVARHERALWTVAVAALVLDVVLTTYGLRIGLVEMNPLAARVIAESGVVGMVALKAAALTVGIVGRSLIPRRYAALVPLALGVPWLLAVGVNAVMIANAL